MLQYQQQQQQQQQPPTDPLPSQSTPTMRLRDDPQPPTSNPTPTTSRPSRKRKSPPSAAPAPAPPSQPQPQQHPPPPPPPPGMHLGMLPPPHTLMPPGMGPPPMYQYAPPDYAQPPPPPGELSQEQLNGHDSDQGLENGKSGGRQLSQSKRAEQNRKAQRAFRERRDQRVKALESRSQLLDAALASADEANRRWEECRALVDQLRIENAALRAALSGQAQMSGPMAPGQILAAPPSQPPQHAQESRPEGEKPETKE